MFLMHDPQLTQQCQCYELEVRKEDAAGLSCEDVDNQMVKMRINGNTTTTTVFPIKEKQPIAVEKPLAQQQNGVSNLNGVNGQDRRTIMRKRQQEAEELRLKQIEQQQQRKLSQEEELFQVCLNYECKWYYKIFN